MIWKWCTQQKLHLRCSNCILHKSITKYCFHHCCSQIKSKLCKRPTIIMLTFKPQSQHQHHFWLLYKCQFADQNRPTCKQVTYIYSYIQFIQIDTANNSLYIITNLLCTYMYSPSLLHTHRENYDILQLPNNIHWWFFLKYSCSLPFD